MKLTHILIVIASALLWSCAGQGDVAPLPDASSAIVLKAEAVEMLPEVVNARSGEEPKTAAEKKINMLHLFFFDKDGNFLTPDPECEADFRPYQIIDMTESGLDGVEVPKNAFIDQQTLEGVQIFAVANPICDDPSCSHTSCSFRVEGLNPKGDICHGDADNPQAVKIISNLADLLSWYYRPAERADITELPEGGMPMVAHYSAEAGDCVLGHSGQIQIPLRALMARVDVKVKLEAKQTSKDRLLPTLKVTEYGVKNMPLCVPFTAGETTAVPQSDMRSEKTVKVSDRTLVDGQEAEVFTYYTYENIKQRTQDPMEIYPEEVKGAGEEVRQRWKPLVAPENASAIVMRGRYVDHQGMSYEAQFSVYLGSDVIDNFEVKRNHCYKNNIFISGLDYVRSDDNVFIFDARVNVSTFNAMYLSIINERHLDAHWCVLPMDVYFFDDNVTSELMVEIEDAENSPWIRMEMVDGEMMKAGGYAAGTGARSYFTKSLMSELDNSATGKSLKVTQNRSRVYFYVDENTDVSSPEYGARTACVKVNYKDDAGRNIENIIEIEQAALKHVTGRIQDYISGAFGQTTHYIDLDCWVECYEDYTYHKDPLDGFSMPGSLYDGLAFGFDGVSFGSGWAGNDNYRIFNRTGNGKWLTDWIINHHSNNLGNLSDVRIYNETAPANIFLYCLGKNKRNDDGTIDFNDYHWYVPAQLELAQALVLYYDDPVFEDSKESFYWSSTPAENTSSIESGSRAKAVKVYSSDGSLKVSACGWNDKYTNQSGTNGNAPKSEKFRVRAFYKK